MKCPFCNQLENRVIDSRLSKDGHAIRRRRECSDCSRRFTTYEKVETTIPMVIKKDGRREQFDREKMKSGILKACQKRSVSIDEIERFVDDLERKIQEQGEREISSQELG
ncbi:MAG: transcriptional regulator NrdR, partial [Deltaproteobacteria bacterium]|nr:transcriptional regulator NrdR [Deltaproteobacteria bacterium]